MVLISNVLGLSLIYSFLLFCSLTDHLQKSEGSPFVQLSLWINIIVRISSCLHSSGIQESQGFPILRGASDPQRLYIARSALVDSKTVVSAEKTVKNTIGSIAGTSQVFQARSSLHLGPRARSIKARAARGYASYSQPSARTSAQRTIYAWRWRRPRLKRLVN